MSDITYRTSSGDVLDAICWRYYGNETSLNAVLDANPGLADQGPVLPSGLTIVFPAIAAPAVSPVVSLWD